MQHAGPSPLEDIRDQLIAAAAREARRQIVRRDDLKGVVMQLVQHSEQELVDAIAARWRAEQDEMYEKDAETTARQIHPENYR